MQKNFEASWPEFLSGNVEHLTSMEKVFSNSMKDNMSHMPPTNTKKKIDTKAMTKALLIIMEYVTAFVKIDQCLIRPQWKVLTNKVWKHCCKSFVAAKDQLKICPNKNVQNAPFSPGVLRHNTTCTNYLIENL